MVKTPWFPVNFPQQTNPLSTFFQGPQEDVQREGRGPLDRDRRWCQRRQCQGDQGRRLQRHRGGLRGLQRPVLCGCCEGHQGSIERPEIRKVLRNAIRLCKKLIDFWWFVDQNDDFGPFFPSQPVSPEAGDIGIRPALCRIWRDRRWKPSFVSAGSARWSFYKVLTGEKGDALLQQSGFADSAKPRAARAADKMM